MAKDDLENRVGKLEQAVDAFSKELRLAFHYIDSDAASSLTKSRLVMEKLLLEIYTTEMGREPHKPMLGDMLADNQFTRKLERRICSRMNSIRDMGNLGPHGEAVESSDAATVLDDLCEVLDWYLRKYPHRASAPAQDKPAAERDAAAVQKSAPADADEQPLLKLIDEYEAGQKRKQKPRLGWNRRTIVTLLIVGVSVIVLKLALSPAKPILRDGSAQAPVGSAIAPGDRPIDRAPPPILDSTDNAVDAATVASIQLRWANFLHIPVVETLDLGGSVKMEFVLIPPGEFMMGSPDGDSDAQPEEKPRHKVRITKPFYFGRTLVTKRQFAAFVAGTGYITDAEQTDDQADKDGAGGYGYNSDKNKFEGRNPQFSWRNSGWAQTDGHPVINVTHHDATKFCEWLEKMKPSWHSQLPSEAQWEYACRGGATTRFLTGDNPQSMEGHGNFRDESLRKKLGRQLDLSQWFAFDDGYAFTSPVENFKANRLQLYDMHGNVLQWCLDGQRKYNAETETDPVGQTEGGSGRMLRGGGFDTVPKYCRAGYRYAAPPSERSYDLGFRSALVPSGESK
jgi:formylglycine-generating enzyme